MDNTALPPSPTPLPTIFLKPRSNLSKILFILIPLLAITAIAGFIYFKHPFNLFQPKKLDINERFISIPGKNDNILNSLPRIIEPGVIYFYTSTASGSKKETASYLEGKIVDIDKTQKSLSVNSANSINKILITTKDYTAVKNIKWDTISKAQPDVKNISFDNLVIGDNISVSNLRYNNQSYIAGTIVKNE